MIFTESPLGGVVTIAIEPHADERGFFARTFDVATFQQRGLPTAIVQSNVSLNHRAGTVRGLHFQRMPHGERKLVRCTAGSIFDVVVDLRPESPTLYAWWGKTLRANRHEAVFIDQGFAHGFQTLEDDTEVFYEMFDPYVSAAAAGVRWNDSRFGISWPLPVTIISPRDAALPDLT